MSQKITIKIAGKEYPMNADSEEMERLFRLAAEDINLKLERFNSQYPGKEMVDMMAFVALNEAISRLYYKKKLSKLEEGIGKLADDTNGYLINIEEDK